VTVLIVDDEEDLRESVRDALEDEGYRTQVACDGVEALQRLADADDVCAVILDVIMPRMDGIAVYHEMQRDSRLAKIPVVFATSDPSRVPEGAMTFRKPFDLVQLISTVEKFCRPQDA
jgi:CheY-like chemotaxis protein